MRRKLHLGALIRPISINTGAWPYRGAWPGGVDDFTATVVPGLPRRGLFRTDHGSTLRDHLGLSRLTNGFFAG